MHYRLTGMFKVLVGISHIIVHFCFNQLNMINLKWFLRFKYLVYFDFTKLSKVNAISK